MRQIVNVCKRVIGLIQNVGDRRDKLPLFGELIFGFYIGEEEIHRFFARNGGMIMLAQHAEVDFVRWSQNHLESLIVPVCM